MQARARDTEYATRKAPSRKFALAGSRRRFRSVALLIATCITLAACDLIVPPVPPVAETGEVASLDVLIVFYTGSNLSRGAAGLRQSDIDHLKAGLELSRLFYWRNSLGRLLLQLDYVEIPSAGPVLSYSVYEYAEVEADLRALGVVDNQYDSVHVISSASDLGCWAGFRILGETTFSVGRTCGVPYPAENRDVDYTMAWCFTHEYQHCLDSIAQQSSHSEMLHGDIETFYDSHRAPGRSYDAGTHYNWQSLALRSFDGYDDLAQPWNGVVQFVDQDGDGFPDDDSRFPLDELRFGSSTSTTDTDGDGLSDLEEFAAGMYAGSNPRVSDTDSDGVNDSADPYPLYDVPSQIRSYTPTVDGFIESGWTALTDFIYYSEAPSFSAVVYAAWDTNYLYFAVKTSTPCTAFLRVDGSGWNGLFEGGDSYEFCIAPQQLEYVGAALNPHGGWQYWSVTPGGEHAYVQAGSWHVIEVAIPYALGQGYGLEGDVVSGLTLASGHRLGLSVVLAGIGSLNGVTDKFHGTKAFIFEPYELVDFTLEGSSSPASSILVTSGIAYAPISDRGETFHLATIPFEYQGGSAFLSLNPDGTGHIMVDDVLEVSVRRPDGTARSATIDFTNDCVDYVAPLPPQDISYLMGYGTNEVTFRFRDQCGAYHGCTTIYLASLP